MNAEEFTAQLKVAIIDENIEIYRDLLDNTKVASDPYWSRALALYNRLDANERGVFLEVVRQVAIDSVSNLLAIVDGVARLPLQDSEICLRCGTDELNGELQDRFLEQFEE